MINIFRKKTLEEQLNKTKKIKVCGMKFIIKKITPFDYLDGSESVLQFYKTYTVGDKAAADFNAKKLQKLYSSVFMAGIVEPKLKRKKEDPEGIYVGNLFTEWELAQKLYEQIFIFTYGKKKMFATFLGSA